jgi:hypothetical protein
MLVVLAALDILPPLLQHPEQYQKILSSQNWGGIMDRHFVCSNKQHLGLTPTMSKSIGFSNLDGRWHHQSRCRIRPEDCFW